MKTNNDTIKALPGQCVHSANSVKEGMNIIAQKRDLNKSENKKIPPKTVYITQGKLIKSGLRRDQKTEDQLMILLHTQ